MSEPEPDRDGAPSLLSSSAVMAAGTMVSRFSGFVRSSLLAAALGLALHADLFTIANTIPNMLYILLAGGIVNAVLVPQLVRAMKAGEAEGAAYTDRVITLALAFLLIVTVALVVAAPWLMRLFLDAELFTPQFTEQRESAIMFARLCLPQVFFYGMFVLVGQVLNARGRFGPMMWAPIANNLVSTAVLVIYLVVFGAAREGETGGYTQGQELLLGLGSTVGIAVQLLVLVPYLRRSGYRFRPRWDFRDAGLGHTLRLGMWTVLLVVVNQIAYTVVVRLASGGTTDAVGEAGNGTGYTVYANAFLLIMVPHSIATVSLATAILPRLSAAAASADLAGVGRQVAGALRTAYAVIVPFALLVPVIATDLANVVWGWGAARDDYVDGVPTLTLFAPALVLFTAHYLMLRGFYALEQTRRVFWVQCVIAVTNVVLAVLLTRGAPPEQTAPRLVLAYGGAYLVGATLSYALLRRQVGGLQTSVLVRFLVRLVLAAGIATLVAAAVATGLDAVWEGDSKLRALAQLVVVGVADAVVLVLLARALRLREVTEITGLVTSRLPGRRARGRETG